MFWVYNESMKLLLVEDNVKLAENVKQGLMQEGYSVDVIYDGLVALRRILMNHSEYDLVILDRMLPGKDGLSICREWRDAKVSLPVIMLTALGDVGDKVNGLNSGADDYLAKPFSFEELLARVHALLRRPKDVSIDKLHIGNIEMDTVSRVVTCSGKTLTLTLKEFMVLEYLMRNQNKVVTRDTLYSHAWDFADSSFSNTVDVHIKNLRKKIKDNGKIIQTVRGVGYKMAN